MKSRPIIIRGERVALGPLVEEDLEKLWCWVNDKELTQYLSDYLFLSVHTLQSEKVWLENALKPQADRVIFAILDANSGKLIGVESLIKIDRFNRHAELGIFIGDKNYWGRGYGSEALVLLLDYAFNVLQLNKVVLRVLEFNKRAIQAYEKIGFKVVGRLRKHKLRWGRYWDELIMEILAEEFKERHKSRFLEVMDPAVKEKFVFEGYPLI